jgi:protocatechuate 3,4-dioxygenase beta subunit
MEPDDEQIGRVLNRREVITLIGAAGVSVLSAGSLAAAAQGQATRPMPACVVRPEQTEGPYFVDEKLEPSDIRADPGGGALSEGVPLDLEFQVSRIGKGSCVPLARALVDVWQCDALGVYSGVRDTGQGFNTLGKKFLRGHQLTDAKGRARFTTIYPGWYQGRTVHIHFKIRTPTSGSRSYEFTSQLYFDDDVTDRVLARAPYSSKGRRAVRNRQDGIFRRGGEQLILAVVPKGEGYTGLFDLGLQLG